MTDGESDEKREVEDAESSEDAAAGSDSGEDDGLEDEESEDEEDAPPKKQSLKERLSDLGGVGLAVYFIIFGLTLAGFAIAIAAGVEVDTAGESGGLLFAAWVATKLTQPLRIGATLVLTPLVYKVWYTIRPKKDEDEESEDEESEDEESEED